jgi:hypothetical protein
MIKEYILEFIWLFVYTQLHLKLTLSGSVFLSSHLPYLKNLVHLISTKLIYFDFGQCFSSHYSLFEFASYSLSFSNLFFSAHGLSFPFWFPALFSSEDVPLLCANCTIVLSQILLPVFPYTGCYMLLFFKWRDSSQHLSHAFLLGVLHFIRNNLFWYGKCRATLWVPISLWARFISLHISFNIREVWGSQRGAAPRHISQESKLQSLDLLPTKRRWYDSSLLSFHP